MRHNQFLSNPSIIVHLNSSPKGSFWLTSHTLYRSFHSVNGPLFTCGPCTPPTQTQPLKWHLPFFAGGGHWNAVFLSYSSLDLCIELVALHFISVLTWILTCLELYWGHTKELWLAFPVASKQLKYLNTLREKERNAEVRRKIWYEQLTFFFFCKLWWPGLLFIIIINIYWDYL